MKKSTLKRKNYFILIALSLFFINCSNSDDNSVEILDTETSIEFFNESYGDSSEQTYDIYLPANRSINSTKMLVLIHGGSWVSGDKSDLSAYYQTLKSKFPNYAVANINYQLAGIGKSPFPMQIQDISNFLDEMDARKEEFQILNEYALIGVSAGGHLAMLFAYDYDIHNEIEMVCSIVGPTNFTDDNYVNNPDYNEAAIAVQLITGESYETNPEFFESVSPYHVVKSSAPPSILFYGGIDELVPSSQGIDMHAKLDELGVTNEFTLYENEGHGWEGDNLEDTYTKLENFINSNF